MRELRGKEQLSLTHSSTYQSNRRHREIRNSQKLPLYCLALPFPGTAPALHRPAPVLSCPATTLALPQCPPCPGITPVLPCPALALPWHCPSTTLPYPSPAPALPCPTPALPHHCPALPRTCLAMCFLRKPGSPSYQMEVSSCWTLGRGGTLLRYLLLITSL